MNILIANFTKMVNDSGGMAKVTCNMANEFIKRGHSVSLIYSDDNVGNFYFPISAKVKCYDLRHIDGENIKFPIRLKIKREIFRLFNKQKSRTVGIEFDEAYLAPKCKKLLEDIDPDVIVSHNPGTSAMFLCTLNTNTPVITMSHGDPSDYFKVYPKVSVEAVGKSNVNQVLLPSYVIPIKKYFPNVKTVVIGNAIPQFNFSADLSATKDRYKIIFVGRLAKGHKRPHLLIQAFSQIASKYPNWIVELWGASEGKAYYKELEYLIKNAKLENRILLKGSTNNVPEKLKDADILAFPSAYEGFSLALGEGMSAGLPVIGYKNCPSVNEIIINGKTGFLVDDGVKPFAEALDKLMSDKELRINMGKSAKEEMLNYAPNNIWDKWDLLLKNTANL